MRHQFAPSRRAWLSQTFRSTGRPAIALMWFALALHSSTVAQPAQETDLLQLSLEDLGKIKVTTVSRKAESIFSAAAAIHVITDEDIRRSGINSIPELLRLAPGLQVSRANSRHWAIGARGFNDIFANKLLVLMDGRTLYTPLFSGVFWEEVDTVLEDVERIEAIRGPGATLWGANAVNGVINIITKSAKETQGLLLSGGGGIEERGFGTLRYGGALGTNAYYRVYAKYSDRDESTLLDTGKGTGDSWWKEQEGFRIDWEPSDKDRLTLQGDYYYGDLGGRFFFQSFTPPRLVPREIRTKAEGLNTLGRWTHQFSSESELSLQMYYDRTHRSFGIGDEIRNTMDIDLQHRFHLGDRQEIVWGGGYRYSVDDLGESPDLQLETPNLGLQLASGFIQDEVALLPDRLHLTLGTKIEHNDFTGFEVQPSARLSWTPTAHHSLWAAVSRAVRTPSRTERDIHLFLDPGNLLPAGLTSTFVRLDGNPDFGSEDLIAYEAGYRFAMSRRLAIDLAVFYHDYDHIRAITSLQLELKTEPVPHLIIPTTFNNDLYGSTYGAELGATWQPIDAWRLRASYSLLQMDAHTHGPVASLTETIEEGAIPQQQFSFWSDADLGQHVEWGIGIRLADALPLQLVPAYTALETRLAWKPNRHCELSIVGRDLLDPHHREVAPSILTFRRVEVDRAIYGKVTLRF